MTLHIYPGDLTDVEWEAIAPLIPPAKPGGRPRSVEVRRIVNGVFYLLRSDCAWRYLPREYGPWPTVYWYFRQWRLDGTWRHIHTRLRELARLHAGRDPTPSTAIIDSQSVKTVKTHAGGTRGFDGAKKVAGRTRHILVDTGGHLLVAVVHAANLHDRDGGRLVLEAVGTTFPRLQRIWADQGYTGSIRQWAAERYGFTLDVVYPLWRQLQRYTPDLLPEFGYEPGFQILSRRWVVERTFSWIGRQRHMSKDDERLTSTAEALIYLVGIRLLLAQLARGSG